MQAFDEYYISCYLNNLITLLMAAEVSYRSFAYENNYYYYFADDIQEPEKGLWDNFTYLMTEIQIEPYIDVYNILFDKQVKVTPGMPFPPLGAEEYVCNCINQLLLDMVKLLDTGYILFVAVDLYYYIEKSSMYHKRSRSHYSMVYAYQNGKFIVYDEGPFGYGQQTVDMDVMQVAMSHAMLNPKCLLYKRHKSIPVYKCNIKRVLENAERICLNIDNIDTMSHVLPNYYDVNGYQEGLNRIMNRQKGNMLMFQDLHNKGELSIKAMETLHNITKILYKQWAVLRNRAIKEVMLKKREDNGFLDIVRQLITDERNMWSYFISAIGG